MVVILTILAALASWCDLKKGIIPNRLLFPGMAAGASLRIVMDLLERKPSDMLIMAAEVIILLICLWPFYAMGGLGAGDCKLLLLAGVFLPVKQAIFVIVSTFFTAAAGIVLLMLFYGVKRKKKKVECIRFAPAFFIAVLLGWLFGSTVFQAM